MVADDQPIDPYVSIDADEHHLDRSSTKPKTFDPVWNETFMHEVHNVGRCVITPLIICLTCYSYFIVDYLTVSSALYLNVIHINSVCATHIYKYGTITANTKLKNSLWSTRSCHHYQNNTNWNVKLLTVTSCL